MTQTIAITTSQTRTGAPMGYTTSLALALSFMLIAAGLTRNDISYIFLAPIFLLAIPLARSRYSNARKLMIMLAMSLSVFGTVKGYFVGHELNYILRFTAPLLAFSLACLFPGIGEALYKHRTAIMFVSIIHTLVVFYVVKTGNFSLAERFIPGWTLTFSSNAAVSVWHYFTLPFCILALDYIRDKRFDAISLIYIGCSIISFILLLLLTDTSAYWLSIIAILLFILAPQWFLKGARVILYIAIPVIIVDFLTLKIISNMVVDFMYNLAIEDVGDVLRLIQLDYFVRYAEFLGSGFGAEHAFPLEIQFDRQVSQIVYPYASELPIINILYNGGILAGLWFFWLAIAIIDLARFRKLKASMSTFGLGCSAVLFGSISNPYLFAPASMLLLAVMFDVWDQTRPQFRPPARNRSAIAPRRQPPV